MNNEGHLPANGGNSDHRRTVPTTTHDVLEMLHRMRTEFPNETIKVEFGYIVHPVFTAEIAPTNSNQDGPNAVSL